jgi:hypothetical protein
MRWSQSLVWSGSIDSGTFSLAYCAELVWDGYIKVQFFNIHIYGYSCLWAQQKSSDASSRSRNLRVTRGECHMSPARYPLRHVAALHEHRLKPSGLVEWYLTEAEQRYKCAPEGCEETYLKFFGLSTF